MRRTRSREFLSDESKLKRVDVEERVRREEVN